MNTSDYITSDRRVESRGKIHPYLPTLKKFVILFLFLFIVMFIPKNLINLKSYNDKQFNLLMYKNQIKLLKKFNDNELKSNAKKYKQLEILIDNIEYYASSS